MTHPQLISQKNLRTVCVTENERLHIYFVNVLFAKVNEAISHLKLKMSDKMPSLKLK